MRSVIGNNIIVSIFGESHNEKMGITINGLASGLVIDKNAIDNDLKRRRPNSTLSTSRVENDEYEIISGVFEGKTTGMPLTIIILNKDFNSSCYEKFVVRPGHADYPAYVKSNYNYDYRGGGAFSGRLTSLLVIAGSICKQLLCKKNICISSKIKSLATDNKKTYDENDSFGGKVEIIVKNMPVGIGEPYFYSLEACISHLLFSVPAVKAVEFGDGVDFANAFGKEVKDELYYENDKVNFVSNHNGGINGGLSNGNDIKVLVTIKPTPSISSIQKTINLETKKNIERAFVGRHDTSIVLRVPVILENVCAIAILDLLLDSYKMETFNE